MKRKTAKEILAESFRELAEKKNIDKITVRDITENCGYSSATFYRQFKDKYDLIVWDHTQRVAEVMNQIGKNDYPWNRTLHDGAKDFQNNKEYHVECAILMSCEKRINKLFLISNCILIAVKNIHFLAFA